MLSIIQGAADELQQLLEDRSHRSESKAWLIRTLSQLQHISPSARWACFHPCWPDTSSAASSSRSAHSQSTHGNAHQPHAEPSALASCRDAELHLLQLLAEQTPADVSALLLRDHYWLCDFLTASRDRIKAWFGHFGPTGIHQFKFGARALANYALAERADVWRHLVWAGKHSQSPVAVAVKPHYFGELDVVPTVQNLARACPGFWASDELMRSCQAGDWLALDRQAVAQELLHLLHDQRSSRYAPLLQLLSDFLATEDWALLCHQLLPLLPDRGLMQVAHALAHHTSIPQRQQQQQLSLQQQWQQQGQGRGSTNTDSLLQAWCCGEQADREAQVAAAAAAAAGGPAEASLQGGLGLSGLQAAAAVAAVRLPCVTDTHLLLVGCLQCADTGSSAWTLKELLMANALTCSRHQLLLLRRQDDDSDSRLPALVSAAAALCAPGSTAGSASAAGPSAGSSAGLAEAAAAVQHLPRSQQLLLLLTAAWLLRLHLLLQLSGSALTAREGRAEQQQQQYVEVQLPTGGKCRLVTSSSTSHSSNPTLGHQQEQRQQTTQPEDVSTFLHGQPAKVPLRRGLPTTGKATAAARGGSDSDSSKGAKRRRKHKHERKSSKSKRARHKGRRHSDSKEEASDSSGSRSDGSSSSSSSGGGRRRRRHKRGRKRRRGNDGGSDEPLSSDDAWAALDLDAGGELLEPTALQAMPHNTSKPAHTALQPHTGTTAADSTPAAPVPAAAGGSSPAACGQAVAAVQQQGLAALSLREVQGRLASLSAGGDLWQWPSCIADVPVIYNSQRGTKLGSSGLVSVSGSIAEVADAVACLWLCGTLAGRCGG